MSLTFNEFGSIDQFRQAIRQVRDYSYRHETPIPTLKFRGTTKIHGTNFGVGYDVDSKEYVFQSRSRIITPQNDNAGSATWAYGSQELKDFFDNIVEKHRPKNSVWVYGEWAGENIQKNVAICNVRKNFYVFTVKIDGEEIDLKTIEIPFDVDNRLFTVYQFDNWEIDIDFTAPEKVQNELVEMTLKVEEQCPIAAKFGYNGIGEGIVFHNIETGIRFKCKGEKHSATKIKSVKKIAEVDVEKMSAISEFIEYAVSENRLNQGLQKMEEIGYDLSDNRTIGPFIKWVANDVFKEECDVICKSEFDTKIVGSRIAEKARQFFQNRV